MSGAQAPPAPRRELEALKSLATARSQEARDALFERMAGMALDPAAVMSAEDRQGMDRLMSDLLRYVERSVRAKVAQRMARLPDPPHQLLQALALDEIEIATPILAESPALSEDALIDIARAGTRPHRQAVAARPDVSERVSEAIVDLDDLDVVETLAGNAQAEIAPRTFDRMASLSENHAPLRQILLQRPDVPPFVAHRMFWWVSGALRRHIVERYSVDMPHLNAMIEEAVHDGLIEASADHGVSRVIDTLTRHSRKPVSELVQILRDESLPGFAGALSERLGIDPATARRIVADTGGEAIAIACRAIEADRGQFTSIFLLLDYKRFGRARPAAALTHVSAIYDRVTHSKAAASVAIWELLRQRDGA